MTWRGWRRGHTRGITPAEFAAMCEGRRFAQNDALELLAWGVSHLLQPYVSKGGKLTMYDLLGRTPPTVEEDQERIEAEREEKRRLLRKIETAQIKESKVVGSFSGRGK